MALGDTEMTPKLDLRVANLHVHWGTPTAVCLMPNSMPNRGIPMPPSMKLRKSSARPGWHPTGGQIKRSGKLFHRRRCYGKFSVSNCDFFLLDTRTHRNLHKADHPDNPKATMLGKQQLNWLKEETGKSKANFLFIVSSVNFMVPHVERRRKRQAGNHQKRRCMDRIS